MHPVDHTTPAMMAHRMLKLEEWKAQEEKDKEAMRFRIVELEKMVAELNEAIRKIKHANQYVEVSRVRGIPHP